MNQSSDDTPVFVCADKQIKMVNHKAKGKSAADPKPSGSIVEDERFSRVSQDPRFRSYKPDTEHVELDKRFENVLTSKRFEVKDDLFFNEESSSSDEASSDEETQFEAVDEWEQHDQSCFRDEQELDFTSRFAICNMDWDRITATDIYILLHSFKRPNGSIESVRIYLSEYGRKRLVDEKLKGPKELIELPEDVGKEDEHAKMISTIKYAVDDDEEMNKLGYVQNKLRKYQINRLRYYYAVAEFDCEDTAMEIYQQLDGYEYLASSVTIDLRIIPNEMQFDEEPASECCKLPDLNFYRAPEFINTALQQTKVRLTWEENNQDMTKKLQKAFEDVENNKDVAYLDDYLASDTENEEDSMSEYESGSSDDEEGVKEGEERKEEVKEEKETNEEVLGFDSKNLAENHSEEVVAKCDKKWSEKNVQPREKKTKKDRVSKYKDLLRSIEDEEERKKKEKSKFDIEINWAPEIGADNAAGGDDADSLADDESDEFDPDMTDEKREKLQKKEKYKKSNKKNKKKQQETEEEKTRRKEANAELELLLLDSEGKDKKHFNYANFVENSKQVSKERKSQKIQQDTFKVCLSFISSTFSLLFIHFFVFSFSLIPKTPGLPPFTILTLSTSIHRTRNLNEQKLSRKSFRRKLNDRIDNFLVISCCLIVF